MKRIIFLLSLIVLSVSCGWAQGPTAIETPQYRFTHFDRNHLIYPGDSLTMERFFEKLDTLFLTGQGHVSIMHIGGSHVQAGVFSQQMRDNLLNLFPGITAGRGLVFPYMMTNTPASYCISRTGEWEYFRNALPFETRMGLAGASVTTSDTAASFSIITREKATRDITPVFDFNLVKVLGYGTMTPVVHFGLDTITGTYNEEEGAFTFHLPDYTDSLYVDFNHDTGTFTVTGVYLDNGMPGITYHGIGINGARVDSYLKCQDLKRDLKLVKPDLVIFGIGINDAADNNFSTERFVKDYSMLVDSIRDVNPDCALIFVTNNDSYRKVSRRKYEVNTNGLLAEQAFMTLGGKYDGAVWDFFDIMGGLKSMKDWEEEGIAQKDKVHFTSAGYALIGDLLFNALMEKYLEHIKNTKK